MTPDVHLTVTGDSGALQSILLPQGITRIGRDPASDVVLRNRFISTAHAEIALMEGRVVFRDRRSTNGSRVRRNRWLIPVDHRCDHETVLEDGDELLLGDEQQPVVLRVTIALPVRAEAGGGVTIMQAVHASELPELPRRMDREALLVLQELAATIQPRQQPDAVARALASWLLAHFTKASHVAVYLREPATQAFRAVATAGPGGDRFPAELSKTVESEILRTGRSLAFTGDVSTSLHDSSVKEGLCAPLVLDGTTIGFVQVDRRKGGVTPCFRRNEVELLAVAAQQASLALELSRLHATYRTTVEKAIGGLIAVMESRDAYMAGHCSAVSSLAGRIATRLHLPEDEVARVQRAGALHDIGRFGVPAEILNAPGALTPEQFERIRSAPVIGADIVSQFGFLSDLVPIIRHVHERWDGSGYPDGLAGDAIPLAARIVAVADAFHTLVSHRAHQEATSQAVALQELAKAAGTRFDPRLVGALEVLVLGSNEIWEFGAATSIGSTLEQELLAPGRK